MRIARIFSMVLFFVLTLSVSSFAEMKAAPPAVADKYNLSLVPPIVDGNFVFLNGTHNFGLSSKCSFHWGDGTTSTGLFPGKHVYKNPGKYMITCEISEDTAAGRVVKTAKIDVTVAKAMKLAPPAIADKYTLSLLPPIVDGNLVFVNGTHNFGPESKRSFDWGDGTIQYGVFPGKHLYKNPGKYTITRTITEDTAAGRVVKTAKADVTIKDIKPAPPEIAKKYVLSLEKPVVVGKTVSLNGGATFGPDAKRSFDWGDGTIEYGPFPGKHTYANPGTYTITRKISEDLPAGRVERIGTVMVTIK